MKVGMAAIDGNRKVVIGDHNNDWHVVSGQSAISSVKRLIVQSNALAQLFESGEKTNQPLQFLAPIKGAEKVLCVGKNYADHAREMGGEAPDLPVIFNKLSSCIIGMAEKIEIPSISNQVDYEAELVVVIGKKGRHIDEAVALYYVFGYTIGNDVSARDWQKGRPGGQWLLGKAFDTFAPLGPFIVTTDEITDPHDLSIELKLNGSVMQSGHTGQLIFRIEKLISHLSKFFTLKPGDLIFTGTPAGVGAGRNPPLYLKSGDKIQITIPEIGTLSNEVA